MNGRCGLINITKPFSVEELLARIRVTQRRLAVIQTGEIQKTAVFINGELKLIILPAVLI